MVKQNLHRNRISYASLDNAREVVSNWNGRVNSLEHIGNSGNSVFRFRNDQNNWQILRLTDSKYRSKSQVDAELLFMSHLKSKKINIVHGIPSRNGPSTITYSIQDKSFIVSSISYANGIIVKKDSEYWSKHLFLEWGKSLGYLHEASKLFDPKDSEPKTWIWEDEVFFKKANELIPSDDLKSQKELREVFELCKSIPKTEDNYGVIHADLGTQNFHYDTRSKRITIFDFGNCCYHWYLFDLAVSISTISNDVNRDKIKQAILNSYDSVSKLPTNFEEQIDLFIRLRVIYVYLSRLFAFGQNPNNEQKEIIEKLKQRVHQKKGGWW